MCSEVAIKAEGLGKAYNLYGRPSDRLKRYLPFRSKDNEFEHWAFRNISISVSFGQTLGVIGRNGAGKSTLMKVLAGLLPASEGRSIVNGDIGGLLQLGTGFNLDFTGRENIYFASSLNGLSRKQTDERIHDIITFAAIGEFIDRPVKFYSTGMHARLAFALAVNMNAEILFIDEVLAVGDAEFTQKCMKFVREFKKEGTILIASHDTKLIVNLCDQVIWIENGQLQAAGEPDEICRRYLEYSYLEKDTDGTFETGGDDYVEVSKAYTADHDAYRKEIGNAVPENKIEIFDFNPNAPWFGSMGAVIESVEIYDETGEITRHTKGGARITIKIECLANREICDPIIGFHVKDYLGQYVFGENTHAFAARDGKIMHNGERFGATFKFILPYFPTGDYSLVAAIAEGTPEDHVQHHWVDEAVILHITETHVPRGLLAIPMQEVRLYHCE